MARDLPYFISIDHSKRAYNAPLKEEMMQPHYELQSQQAEMTLNPAMPVYEEGLEVHIGKRLRELRHSRGLSLRVLAKKSGLAENTLNLIECGKTSPNVLTLLQLAVTFDIPIVSFFETNVIPEPVVFTRKDQRAHSMLPYGEIEVLGEASNIEGLQPFVITIDPKASSDPQQLNNVGTAFIYCIAGQVIIDVNDEEYTLTVGDSLLFPLKGSLTWNNPLDHPAQIILAVAVDSQNI